MLDSVVGMIAMWRKVLEVEDIQATTDFFEIGGNSLLAAQLMWEIEERFRVSLDLPDLFEHPTPVELVELVEARAST